MNMLLSKLIQLVYFIIWESALAEYQLEHQFSLEKLYFKWEKKLN